jgi:hypothetical protein
MVGASATSSNHMGKAQQGTQGLASGLDGMLLSGCRQPKL